MAGSALPVPSEGGLTLYDRELKTTVKVSLGIFFT